MIDNVEAHAWSPDGAKVVYSQETTGAVRRLFILDLTSGEVRDLGEGMNPAWSPDGQWIAFVRGDRASLQVVRPDGTDERVLRRRAGAAGMNYSWPFPGFYRALFAPHSEGVVYEHLEFAGLGVSHHELYYLPLDGEAEPCRLTAGLREDVIPVAWLDEP